MISPDQTLLHLTSRGSRVRTLEDGAVGQWINSSQQPIHNVNKFGLLHYSVPKTLDTVHATNRQFTILFRYKDGTTKSIPVTLPLMDYYGTTLDSAGGGEVLYTNQSCFTEILQTSINWAIQLDGYNHVAPLPPPRGSDKANRLGCVVKMKYGRLKFLFGYRGNVHTVTAAETNNPASPYYNDPAADPPVPEAQQYHVGEKVVKSNTGCPWPTNTAELTDQPHE